MRRTTISLLIIGLCFWIPIGALIDYNISNVPYRLWWDFEKDTIEMWKPIHKQIIIPYEVKQHWNNTYNNRWIEPYIFNKNIEVEFFGN